MTPESLRAELDNDPLGLGYVGRDDGEAAGLLAKADRPGYVPARDVVVVLARRLLWGMVPLAVHRRKLPDGTDCPYPLFNLLATVHLAAFAGIEPPLRLEVAELTPALAAIPDALIPADAKQAILAAAVPVSRAEELWGYGAAVAPADVEFARTRL